ncbi:MAG: 4-hydroxy-tetrahydrodipicolinate synthase [Agathobacter sp.]|nr:4-hydroxy-tetrahydrodipicolinate synthase [Agathobacter sp.]
MEVFTGSGVALITPFYEDKQVNYEMLSILIDRQVNAHTDAIIICGTTGEPATLSLEERAKVIRHTIERVGKRIPVIVGTGANSTQSAVENAIEAQQLGADAILVVTPFYNKATQNGLYLHYKMIADAVTLPVIIYNVPSRTGCNILPLTVKRLVDSCKNIAGVKEASGNISQVADLAKLVGNRVAIYSGNDDQIIPVLSLGGKGVISVLANVFPQQTHDMVTEYLNGNAKAALQLQLEYLPFVHTLFLEVNPIPVKAAMEELGYPCGGLRLPLTEIEDAHRMELVKELHKLIK